MVTNLVCNVMVGIHLHMRVSTYCERILLNYLRKILQVFLKTVLEGIVHRNLNFQKNNYELIDFFPMHPFSTPCKH